MHKPESLFQSIRKYVNTFEIPFLGIILTLCEKQLLMKKARNSRPLILFFEGRFKL